MYISSRTIIVVIYIIYKFEITEIVLKIALTDSIFLASSEITTNIHRPCHCTVQWRTFTGPAIVLSNGEHSHALALYCLVVCCHSQALPLYCLIVCCYSFCDSVRSIWVEAIYLCMIIPLDMDTEQYWWYPRDLSIYDNPIRHWYRTVLVIPSGFIYIW